MINLACPNLSRIPQTSQLDPSQPFFLSHSDITWLQDHFIYFINIKIGKDWVIYVVPISKYLDCTLCMLGYFLSSDEFLI